MVSILLIYLIILMINVIFYDQRVVIMYFNEISLTITVNFTCDML